MAKKRRTCRLKSRNKRPNKGRKPCRGKDKRSW